jgi:hypothetical protein
MQQLEGCKARRPAEEFAKVEGVHRHGGLPSSFEREHEPCQDHLSAVSAQWTMPTIGHHTS